MVSFQRLFEAQREPVAVWQHYKWLSAWLRFCDLKLKTAKCVPPNVVLHWVKQTGTFDFCHYHPDLEPAGAQGHIVLLQQPYLVSRSNVLLLSVNVDSLGDVWTLLLQSHQYVTCLIVKTYRRKKVTERKTEGHREHFLSLSRLFSHLCRSCRSQCVWWCLWPPSGSPRWPGMWSLHRATPCQSYTPSLSIQSTHYKCSFFCKKYLVI